MTKFNALLVLTHHCGHQQTHELVADTAHNLQVKASLLQNHAPHSLCTDCGNRKIAELRKSNGVRKVRSR